MLIYRLRFCGPVIISNLVSNVICKLTFYHKLRLQFNLTDTQNLHLKREATNVAIYHSIFHGQILLGGLMGYFNNNIFKLYSGIRRLCASHYV